MEALIFDKNYNNKLNCDCFSSFTLPDKKFNIGNILEIRLKTGPGIITFQAEIIEIRALCLSQVNNYISYLDLGMNMPDFKSFIFNKYKDRVRDFSTQVFYFTLFERLK